MDHIRCCCSHAVGTCQLYWALWPWEGRWLRKQSGSFSFVECELLYYQLHNFQLTKAFGSPLQKGLIWTALFEYTSKTTSRSLSSNDDSGFIPAFLVQVHGSTIDGDIMFIIFMQWVVVIEMMSLFKNCLFSAYWHMLEIVLTYLVHVQRDCNIYLRAMFIWHVTRLQMIDVIQNSWASFSIYVSCFFFWIWALSRLRTFNNVWELSRIFNYNCQSKF